MTKLCKDCKYYRKDFWAHIFDRTDYWDLCVRPDRENLVSGGTKAYRCAYERIYDMYCGAEGKYWEAK